MIRVIFFAKCLEFRDQEKHSIYIREYYLVWNDTQSKSLMLVKLDIQFATEGGRHFSLNPNLNTLKQQLVHRCIPFFIS
jgi:hypothetical protein